MRQLREEREFHRQMVEAERAWREQQAQAERDWKAQEREARAAEARRVEERHQRDHRAANTRFWLGFGIAVVLAVLGHLLQRWLPLP